MSKKTTYLGVCVLLVMGLMSCDITPTTAPSEENITVSQGIPTDQIQWVSWKQEVVDQIKGSKLFKRGTKTKLIKADKGGKVGGGHTFHNKVKIPKHALEEDTHITIDVLCVDGNEQCGAGVDFLPSMQFLKNVEITLSWEFFDLDEDSDFQQLLYYSENSGETWFPVDSDIEIDYRKETIKFEVDHFTRFAWGF